jgi:propionyl-CoA carboxylase alpha chain
MSQIQTLLIANRGEIARRIIRTCRAMAISPVVVYSDADADAPFVHEADAGMRLPGTAAADTYLRGELVIAAAIRLGADAVHPGYGFLSENAAFARSVLDAGLVWVGPPPSSIAAMGSKIEAKRLARAHGVPVAPDNTVETLDEIGLPALVKASAGGGGRGMRIVREAAALADATASAEREAASSFGDGTVFVERYMEGARHVEVQVFADSHGNVVALGERDCTIQRRHQKVVEEAPSPAVGPELRARMFAAAVAAARAVGYVGAGTVEFMLAADGRFSFLEMNTRLQVEHPVTEMVTGLDLVELQLRVAQGEPLPTNVRHGVEPRGHAIEVRLCTEDPYNGYLPSSGTFHHVEFRQVQGLRVDSAIESGSVVSSHYDSMVAKVIVHGDTRADAARRLRVALERARICGPTTNRALLIHLMAQLTTIDDPTGATVHTGWLDEQDLGEAPSPSTLQIAAAALAMVDTHHSGSPFPIGWRNNPSQPHTQAIGEHVVAYSFDRSNHLELLQVDGEAVELDEFTRDQLARVDACVIDDTVYVAGGLFALAVPPRFADPDDAGRAGSTVAPMPGKVIRLLVAAGDEVTAGQPLLIIEAMKMDHQVVSPTTGTVADVFVHEGQQLDHGQPLVKVDPT